MEPHFDKLYTIEIAPHYFNNTREKYSGNKINFILGDSTNILNVLMNIIDNECIFFLDGHWSAGDTGKENKDCPLIEECTTILQSYNQKGIIIIDDFRLFGLGPHNNTEICDWKDISKNNIIEILKPRITDIYHLPSSLHEQDRLIIHIKEK